VEIDGRKGCWANRVEELERESILFYQINQTTEEEGHREGVGELTADGGGREEEEMGIEFN
jgi:hypothetical protein